MTFNKKRPHVARGLSDKGDLIQTQGESTMNLNREVVIEPEQVSNSKVCTPEARGPKFRREALVKLSPPFHSSYLYFRVGVVLDCL